MGFGISIYMRSGWEWDSGFQFTRGRDGNGIWDFNLRAVGIGMGFGILTFSRSGWEWDLGF